MNLTRYSEFLDKGIGKVSHWTGQISVVLLVAMTAIVAVAVTGRYVFSLPLRGFAEMMALALTSLVFLSFALVERQDRHIEVSVLSSRFSPSLQLLVRGSGRFLAAGVMVLVTWSCLLLAEMNRAAYSITNILGIPEALIYFIMAVGSAVAALAFASSFSHCMKQLAKTRRKLLLWLIAIIPVLVLLLAVPTVVELGVSNLTIGIIGVTAMVLLLLLGIPIGAVMLFVGYLGVSQVVSISAGRAFLATVPYQITIEPTWVVLPLFIFMGNIVAEARLAQDIYTTFHKWIGQLPGGLSMATIGGCAGFAAVCGDSLTTAVTMGKVALPEMRRYKYQASLATGTLAAGGTLGILIPPSLGFIVYGIITEVSIGKLFIAGILPGIMLALMFMALIYFRVRMNPSLAALAPGVSWKEKLLSLRLSIATLGLFLFIMGGIFAGAFTPAEAGGMGAFGAILIALILRRWTWQGFAAAAREGASLNGAVFFIFIGAMVLGHFVATSRLPNEMSSILAAIPSKWGVFGGILLMYIILGCIMNIMPAMIITLPLIFPTVLALGFDPIWFGVIMVITMEMGQITPPVGINVFGIYGVARDVPMATIFRGIFPFLLMMLLAIGILAVFPQIATFLPNLVK